MDSRAGIVVKLTDQNLSRISVLDFCVGDAGFKQIFFSPIKFILVEMSVCVCVQLISYYLN